MPSNLNPVAALHDVIITLDADDDTLTLSWSDPTASTGTNAVTIDQDSAVDHTLRNLLFADQPPFHAPSRAEMAAGKPLTFSPGVTPDGDPVVVDLTAVGHLLIQGAGTGRTAIVRSLVHQLADNGDADVALLGRSPLTLLHEIVNPNVILYDQYGLSIAQHLEELALDLDERESFFDRYRIDSFEEYRKAGFDDFRPSVTVLDCVEQCLSEWALLSAPARVADDLDRLLTMGPRFGLHTILVRAAERGVEGDALAGLPILSVSGPHSGRVDLPEGSARFIPYRE